MKLRIEKDALADAVTWVARTLPSSPPNPVLAGMLIETDADGTLQLSGFDQSVSARARISADVSDPGQVVVFGRLLNDIVKSLPNRPVDITTDGNRVEVMCGSGRFAMQTMPIEDYPALPVFPATLGNVAGSDFTNAVAQVAVAAATAKPSQSAPSQMVTLLGINMMIEGDRMTLMATDRYRLAVATLPWRPETPDLQTTTLVQARTLSDIAKSLGAVGDIELARADAGSDVIGLAAGGRKTTVLLIEGKYPAVLGLFPTEHSGSTVVNTAELIEAVRRVSLVVPQSMGGGAVRLRFADSAIVLEAGAGEDAQATESVEAEVSGNEITIALNFTYLLDGLTKVPTENVQLTYTEANKPVTITGAGEHPQGEGYDFRYLVLPVKM